MIFASRKHARMLVRVYGRMHDQCAQFPLRPLWNIPGRMGMVFRPGISNLIARAILLKE